MTEYILTVRRLPGFPGTPPTMRFEKEGEVLWEARLDERIEAILAGRWSCQLLAREDRGEMEILGEAPADHTPPPAPGPPATAWKPKLQD